MAKYNTNAAGRRALARIRKIEPLIEGSLNITYKRCGNPKCRCVEQGPIHEAALLTWKENQKTHTLSVPRALRKEVKQWVDQKRLLKRLVREMSEAQRQYLMARKKRLKR